MKNEVTTKEFEIAALAMEKNKLEVENSTLENLRVRTIELEDEKHDSQGENIGLNTLISLSHWSCFNLWGDI